MKHYFALVIVCLLVGSWVTVTRTKSLRLQKNITGSGLSPKSVVNNGKGLFFSQNMMYNHNISVFNRQFQRIKVINDGVELSKFGFTEYKGKQQGAPVECAFSHDGLYAWVSNYQMYGKGFNRAGEDNCPTSDAYDKSFVYKINTQTLAIEQVVEAGAVPKYVAATPDSRLVLVSNWCSGDVTVIDANVGNTLKSVYLGAHPRGMVVDSRSEKAYVAVMGSSHIGVIDLADYSVSWIKNIGSGPRHLCISPDDKFLYATLNQDGKVAKIDLNTRKVTAKVTTGNAPRSMAMMGNGAYLYVVNYFSNTLSKIRSADMKVVENVSTSSHPIGVTTDAEAQTIWVACYSGNIMVFKDNDLKNPVNMPTNTPIMAIAPNKPIVRVVPIPPLANAPKPQEILKKAPIAMVKEQTTMRKNIAVNAIVNHFYVIVGSYNNRAKAAQAVEELKEKGIVKAQIVTTNSQFRIAANAYKTKAEASQAMGPIKSKIHADAWVLAL